MLSSPHAGLIAHRAAGRACGKPIALGQATSYQWAAACHEMWEAGRIDDVEFAARLLRPCYPDMTYLESLVALFDGLPRTPPAPAAFCDDPAAEIQIVRRPGCDAVL